MALIEAVVGERRAASNVQSDVRAGTYSELITNDIGFGRFFEAVRLGKVFHTISKAVTVAATHNSPISAVTATPVVGFLNPIGNNKAAVIIRVGFSSVSGTPAGGQAVLNAIPGVTTTPSTAATGSIYGGLLTSAQSSTMRAENNVALTALVPVVGQEVLLVGSAAAAAVAGNGGVGGPTGEDIGGLIVVPPACLLALMAGSGAGTSWIVNASLSWVEIDWPL